MFYIQPASIKKSFENGTQNFDVFLSSQVSVLFTYWENDNPSHIEPGKQKYGGPFLHEQVEDVKAMFRSSHHSLGSFWRRVFNATLNNEDCWMSSNSTNVSNNKSTAHLISHDDS